MYKKKWWHFLYIAVLTKPRWDVFFAAEISWQFWWVWQIVFSKNGHSNISSSSCFSSRMLLRGSGRAVLLLPNWTKCGRGDFLRPWELAYTSDGVFTRPWDPSHCLLKEKQDHMEKLHGDVLANNHNYDLRWEPASASRHVNMPAIRESIPKSWSCTRWCQEELKWAISSEPCQLAQHALWYLLISSIQLISPQLSVSDSSFPSSVESFSTILSPPLQYKVKIF